MSPLFLAALVSFSLSYFSAVDVQPGLLFTFPLRNRHVPALVLSSRPAEKSKAELKNSSFAIRKADSKMKPAQIFLPEFINAAQEAR